MVCKWRKNFPTTVASDCGSAAKRALEQDESCDEDDVTSIQTYETALTLAKDLQLFCVSKGEKVIAAWRMQNCPQECAYSFVRYIIRI